ncbi:MAG: ATP-binding protein [Cellulomonadaceae bacterium]|jgi:hypothetical protein|nr:ATP-binding protein [Cellulomonadaceae bacterium]
MVDRRLNPYTPNAGARPFALAGRSEQQEHFQVLVHRLARGYTEKSMLLTGLRGVGKTVLLGDFARVASEIGWRVVEIEVPRADTDAEFRRQIAVGTRKAILSLSTANRLREKARRAVSVLRNFTVSVDPDGKLTAGITFEPAPGEADVGDLPQDLTDLFLSVGEAARESESGVVYLIDEIQFLTRTQLEALIMALHKTVQKAVPVTVVGAGLPQIAKLSGDAKSYSERLFTFAQIGALSADATRDALARPAADAGAQFSADALDLCCETTQGYPYFVQELGYAAWNMARNSTIDTAVIQLAEPDYTARLDASFFHVRLDRATQREREYLRAMAELGPTPHGAGEVAGLLGRTVQQAGPLRAGLIKKGLLYSTADHGLAQFTVPQFDSFIKRVMPTLTVTPMRSR